MFRRLLTMAMVFAMVLSLGIGANAAKLDQEVSDFDFQDLTYQDCGKDIAKEITKQPGTIKIPSNAHSNDAAAIFATFNWNVKQKNDCVLTVATEPGTFGTFYSFSLLIQSSGAYKTVDIDKPGVYEITKGAKNINMVYISNVVKHEFAKIHVSKVWLDEDGNTADPDLTATFTGGYQLGENLVEINDRIAFEEDEIDGYDLVDITLDGKPIDAVDFQAEANTEYDIVFTNQKIAEEPPPPTTTEALSGGIKIPNRNQTDRWSQYGLGFEWAENNHLEDSYIIVHNPEEFFGQYQSATIVVSCSSGGNVTITLDADTTGDSQTDGSMYYYLYGYTPNPDASINHATLVSLMEYVK